MEAISVVWAPNGVKIRSWRFERGLDLLGGRGVKLSVGPGSYGRKVNP